MAVGLTGEPGAAAVRRAVVDHKHACALVLIQLLQVVALDVQELVPSHNRATSMDV